MSSPLITFRNLDKWYGAQQVLEQVKLSLYSGQCILLAGENGSGKTTLLKILAGLETPTRAEVEYADTTQPWKTAVRRYRREVIYLHQTPYLFNGTIASNVAYGLRFTGLNREQQQQALARGLAWANLTEQAKRPAHTLSGGIRQRVAFTRAWVLSPKILLLDEPIANMDDASRKQTCDLLGRMKSAGMSIVITSHDAQPFETLADVRFQLENNQLRPCELHSTARESV